MVTNLKWELANLMRGAAIETHKFKLRVLEYYFKRKNYPEVFDNWTQPYSSEEYVKLVLSKKIPVNILPDEEGYFSYVHNVDDAAFENDRLYNILNKYSLKEIKEYLTIDSFGENDQYDTTPKSLIDLSIELFKQNGRSGNLLDLCCGSGTFLYEAKNNNIATNYYGVEINLNSYVLSLIKMYIDDDSNTTIYRDNVFNPIDILTNKSKIKFSHVFSNFPFGLKIPESEKINLSSEYSTNNDLPLQRRNTSDYSFISLMLRNLEKSGKAISITAGGALFNTIDQDIRTYMVKKGLIEAIIELPEKLFYNTGVKTYMMVMSFGNTKVKFIDLSKCIKEKQRNINILDSDRALEIINSNTESKYVKIKNKEEINRENYNLVPSTYIHQNKIEILNGCNLDEVAEVFTGWQVSSSQLDQKYTKLSDNSDNIVQIIQMSDVNDGVINRKSNLYKVDQKQIEKFSLQNGDVIITTKSAKVKSAIVEIKEGEKLIASGNIMVIRADRKKIDPYYLRAFIDSPIGQQLLSLKQTGNFIPNLTINNVKKMQVPLISPVKQKQLAEIYKDKFDKIVFGKKRLERLEKEVDSLFDFVTSGEVDG